MLPATFHFAITPEDFREAQTQHLWNGSRYVKRTRWISIVAIASVLVGSGFIFTGKPVGGALLVGGMLFLIMQRLRIASSVRAFTRDQEQYRKLQAEFSETGFRVITEAGQRSWNWRELPQALESENLFMIYLDDKSFFAFSKHAMTAEQVSEVREVLRASLPRLLVTTREAAAQRGKT